MAEINKYISEEISTKTYSLCKNSNIAPMFFFLTNSCFIVNNSKYTVLRKMIDACKTLTCLVENEEQNSSVDSNNFLFKQLTVILTELPSYCTAIKKNTF